MSWIAFKKSVDPRMNARTTMNIFEALQLGVVFIGFAGRQHGCSVSIGIRYSKRRAGRGAQIEGTFVCRALLSEKSVLAAMTYANLNPVRANIASDISTSRYTSVKIRNKRLRRNPEYANQRLRPLVGVRSFNMTINSEAEYIHVVGFTGREIPANAAKLQRTSPRR